jgi:ATP:ADP antiporter, AAA family
MLCAAAVTAQFVSGRATRDALLLSSLDLAALPAMLMVTSAVSILFVAANGRAARRFPPTVLVPASFVASGVCFLLEAAFRSSAPTAAAVILYLHISAAGPLLTSGFWLIASERFDPRSAKRHFGRIASVGTLGGLASAVVTERVAASMGVPAMLPLLAALHFVCAVLVRRLATTFPVPAAPAVSEPAPGRTRSGLHVLAEAPYLRHLATLVLLGTTGAALVDYLFKTEAVATFGRGDMLLRFFSVYYAATSLLTFLVQTSASRTVLERFGLAATASTPSGALLAGSLGSLIVPGFPSLLLARASESVFRSSLFRAGYELFYTPIPSEEKRAAKSFIDVGFDRLGDAVGGGLVRLVFLLAPAAESSDVILGLAVACSAAAMFAASWLNRGYLGTLESSLLHRASNLDPETEHGTRAPTFARLRREAALARSEQQRGRREEPVRITTLDPDVRDIFNLRSHDRTRVLSVLSREDGLSAALVPHAIPLLAWDPVADHVMFALRKVAEERVGQLVDALLDPNQEFAVRRRLARVFSVCVSERAAGGLMLALDDPRFDVRYDCARSLAAIRDKNPRIRIDADAIYAAVLREVAVSRGVWESRRLLDAADTGERASRLDKFVRHRAGESLGHVFTLLSLVLPREPLQIAFRSLHTDDEQLRGTALEYLEGVLPAAIRQRLWPFLDPPALRQTSRPKDDVIADLLRSHHSININLESLRQRTLTVPVPSAG